MTQPDAEQGKGQLFSKKYPPKNRRPNLLGVITLEIAWKGGSIQLDPNGAALAAYQENLPLGEPMYPSDLCGEPGYEYRTDDVTVALTREELYRLLRHSLTRQEYFTLAEKYGVFYEIHDDFYDEDTGQAMQPFSREADADITIITSTAGDWVQIRHQDQVMAEGHSISTDMLVNLLRQLGHSVAHKEKSPDEF